jgi:hypothetical protein
VITASHSCLRRFVATSHTASPWPSVTSCIPVVAAVGHRFVLISPVRRPFAPTAGVLGCSTGLSDSGKGTTDNVGMRVSAHVENGETHENSQDERATGGKRQMVEQEATGVVAIGAKRLR